MKRFPGISLSVLLTLPLMVQAAPPATPELTEWSVPWENSRPRDPSVGPQENTVWFVGQRGDYVARLAPTTGKLKRYMLEPGTGPHTVISDERGVWYAGSGADHIGRLDPESGDIKPYRLEGNGPKDVHTMAFNDEGDIWFTEQAGNRIGLLDVDQYDFTMYDVGTEQARPYGIVVGPGDRPWVTLFGTNKLATIKEGGVLQEIALPRDKSRPRRLDVADDGTVWYVDYAEGYLGRLNPKTLKADEWQTPGGEDAQPYAMALDDDGNVWFVESGTRPNRLIGFDPATETFNEPADIESGGGTVRHMVFDKETNTLWFGTDTNTIVRAQLK